MHVVKTGLVFLVVIALLIAGITGCGNSKEEPGIPIKATWINADVADSTVTLKVQDVEDNTITHFALSSDIGRLAFMAYKLDDVIHVRANICPPCRSSSFSLKGDELVCDTCKTSFKAEDGTGILGACIDYPKAAATYQIKNGEIIAQGEELLKAYYNTLTAGMP